MKKQKPSEDFLHQERSAYNRQSGNKTLFLFAGLLIIIIVLSITTILLI